MIYLHTLFFKLYPFFLYKMKSDFFLHTLLFHIAVFIVTASVKLQKGQNNIKEVSNTCGLYFFEVLHTF